MRIRPYNPLTDGKVGDLGADFDNLAGDITAKNVRIWHLPKGSVLEHVVDGVDCDSIIFDNYLIWSWMIIGRVPNHKWIGLGARYPCALVARQAIRL